MLKSLIGAGDSFIRSASLRTVTACSICSFATPFLFKSLNCTERFFAISIKTDCRSLFEMSSATVSLIIMASLLKISRRPSPAAFRSPTHWVWIFHFPIAPQSALIRPKFEQTPLATGPQLLALFVFRSDGLFPFRLNGDCPDKCQVLCHDILGSLLPHCH